MTLTRMPNALRVTGGKYGCRWFITFNDAWTAYTQCDPKAEVERESYLTAFTFAEDLRTYMRGNGNSESGYDGPCWAPWLWWDIDRSDNLDAALSDARRLAAKILERYRTLDEDDLLLFFSGSKGFHVGQPVTWNPEPSITFNQTVKQLALALASKFKVSIDATVYTKVGLFRAPNSRHPKTKLHKRRLSYKELMNLGIDRIKQLAQSPEPFDLPEVTAPDPQAVNDWQDALQAVQRETETKEKCRVAVANGEIRINRATFDFLQEEVEQGERELRLFSAAANLAEFSNVPDLIRALLSEPARHLGLTPKEVRHAIECGLNHVQKGKISHGQ